MESDKIREVLEELSSIVGVDDVLLSVPDKFVYSRDSWPKSIIWTRNGRAPYEPCCIVFPETAQEVASILEIAARFNVPIVPMGGGSGVCGGTVPLSGGITIDMKRMKRMISVDEVSLVAEVETGIIGAHLEEHLNARGFTLGHFPSSIMCSTLGGWLAARSAGQCSSRYGKIEDMVEGMEVVLPGGEIVEIRPMPVHMSGVDWNQIFTGSEGTLGIITKAWLRINRLPKKRVFAAYNFPSVKDGLAAMREIMQSGLAPAVLRLYDPIDTLINKTHTDREANEIAALAAENPALSKLLGASVLGEGKIKAYSFMLRHPKLFNRITFKLPVGAMLIAIFEGEEPIADASFEAGKAIFEKHKGTYLGEEPARYWYKHRYSISFKQMDVFRAGGFVDTMEVAAPWSRIEQVYENVREALFPLAFVMAHFSHAYEDGCAVYFTFSSAVSGGDDKLLERYDDVWNTALKAVHESGATISHHHGVGWNKSAFMISEHGSLMSVYRALKEQFDPQGIMNPGKMGI